MLDVKTEVYRFLDEHGIDYETFDHEPVHTIEDCAVSEKALHADMPKNLFLTPRNQSAFYLLIARGQAEFRTSDVSKQIGSSRLSFAGPDRLMEMLSTLPGAISPMGLIFDREKRVKLLVDKWLLSTERLAFHPCVNTASFAVSTKDFFEKLLPALGAEPTFVTVGEPAE